MHRTAWKGNIRRARNVKRLRSPTNSRDRRDVTVHQRNSAFTVGFMEHIPPEGFSFGAWLSGH
jgi:hypothetical protein